MVLAVVGHGACCYRAWCLLLQAVVAACDVSVLFELPRQLRRPSTASSKMVCEVMCTGMCVYMCMCMCVDMRIGMRKSMYIKMCINMCLDLCMCV